MPFDVAGNFTRSYNFQEDRDNGIKILAARVDGEFDNFATGMNAVFFRDGRVPMQADLRMNINRVTGLADGGAAAPALKFSTDPNTGPYLDGLSRYAISVNGVQRGVFTTAGFDLAGNFSVTGNASVTGNVSVTGTGAFRSPGIGTSGGVRIIGDATSADAVLQFTDSTQATEFGNIKTSAGLMLLNATAVQAPTPGTADNTTKIATTAYVQANLASYPTTTVANATYAPIASPTFTGVPAAPTPATADNTTKLATTAYVQNNLANYNTITVANATFMPIAGGAFTGNITVNNAAASASVFFTGAGKYLNYDGTNFNLVGGALVMTNSIVCGSLGDFTTPGSGSTGGVRLRAQADNSQAYLQVVNNNATAQWGFHKYTSDGVFYWSGAFTAQGNITSLSDERLKSGIRPLENARAMVQRLEGVRYVKDGKPDLGLIAQRVQPVVPEVVCMDQQGYLSIDYGRLVALLIQDNNELAARLGRAGL